MKQKERRVQKLRMSEYRCRKRLADLKLAIFLIKEKVNENNVSLPEAADKALSHAIKVVEQV